jgi:hypothetical protein
VGEGESSGEAEGLAAGEGVKPGGVVVQASKSRGSKKARDQEERRTVITIGFSKQVDG